MDQAPKLAGWVVKAYGTCFTTLEAELHQRCGRIFLPQAWGVSGPVETAQQAAAVARARARALMGKINEDLPACFRVEVAFLGIEEHELELLACLVALGGGLAHDEPEGLKRRRRREEGVRLIVGDVLRNPP